MLISGWLRESPLSAKLYVERIYIKHNMKHTNILHTTTYMYGLKPEKKN